MQAGLIWVSGVAPMLLLHWAQGKTPDEFPLFAVALGIVCVWYLVLPKKPMADILLLGLLAAFILLPWFKDMFPSPPGSTKLGFLNKQLWLRVGFYFNILRIQFPKLSTWVIPFAAVGTFVGVYLFLALLEEFMFRGVLQQVLIQGLGSKWTGLILASLCFGSVHLPFREFPNWRFALLSTVAGVFYGLAYEKANSLRAAMITHSLVVTLWTIVFSRSL
jgi:membrane protease YdiL (CAAX protease family)